MALCDPSRTAYKLEAPLARIQGWFCLVLLGCAWVSAANADTYTYDAQGRLASVTYTAGGSVTYSYDASGNRTQQVKSP